MGNGNVYANGNGHEIDDHEMHVYDHLCRRHHDDHHAVPNDDCVSDDPIDIIC